MKVIPAFGTDGAPSGLVGEDEFASFMTGGRPTGFIYTVDGDRLNTAYITRFGRGFDWPDPAPAREEAPRAVQQTLPLEAAAHRRSPIRTVREAVGDGWVPFGEVCKAAAGIDPGISEEQVYRALGAMVQGGILERYPPMAEGKRSRKEVCEYRRRRGPE